MFSIFQKKKKAKNTPVLATTTTKRPLTKELAYEPRARLPVRPGGLCRRRLDGTLPVGY